MSDREFVSTTGTLHLAGPYLNLATAETFLAAQCNSGIKPDPLVVQQPVKDCKRCYPKGRTE